MLQILYVYSTRRRVKNAIVTPMAYHTTLQPQLNKSVLPCGVSKLLTVGNILY